jgi:arylsulfatase A
MRPWLMVLGVGILAMPAAERPNIVLILADDLGWTDLSCQGSDLYRTPHLDALAARGVRCTQAYSACMVCSPSRAALLTGQSPARLHLTDWIPGNGSTDKPLREPEWTRSLPTNAPTIAELLSANGYRTAAIGKWHLGGPEATPGRRGFQLALGGNHLGGPPSYFAPYGIDTLTDGAKGEYLTDRLAAEAVQVIEDRHDERPFFLYLAQYAVHLPMQAPASEVAACQARVRPDGRHRDATYAAMVENFDTTCGTVFAALSRTGAERSTLVIVTSDNGGVCWAWNEDGTKRTITSNAPAKGGKATNDDGGVRVPFIAAWPGHIPAGRNDPTPNIGTDVFPTILAAAGITAPADLPADGINLLPTLTGSGPALREDLFWHYPHYHAYGATPHSAIRHGDLRLVETFEDHRMQLFDLAADPGETVDLAARHPELVTELASRLETWRRSVEAQMPQTTSSDRRR